MGERHPYGNEESRWNALLERDPGAGDKFIYAVRTTGVFCRPGCASRLPKRINVEFFDSADAARQAGYRPCLRCHPDSGSPGAALAVLIARACRRLEGEAAVPGLEELAREAGLSPRHFQRLFKAETGVTPKQYAAGCRRERFQKALRSEENVTEAIYQAGYGSSSRAYEKNTSALGMTPSAYRRGGAGELIHWATAACSLGRVLAAATDRGLCTIELGDDDAELVRHLEQRFPRARFAAAGPGFSSSLQQVVDLIDGRRNGLALPLDIRGTAFQRQVWGALRETGPGTTLSYAQLAVRLGRPSAARAVAGACAKNPLAVAIPCHRVLRGDGSLGGYRWGAARKQTLLQQERKEAEPAGGAGREDR